MKIQMATAKRIESGSEISDSCDVCCGRRGKAILSDVQATEEVVRDSMTEPCWMKSRQDAKREMKHRCAVWSNC